MDPVAAASQVERFAEGRLVLFWDQRCPESRRLAALLSSSAVEPKLVSLGTHRPNWMEHAAMYAVDPSQRPLFARKLLESDGRWESVLSILRELGSDQARARDLVSSEDSPTLRLSQEDQRLAEGIGLRYMPVGILRTGGELRPITGMELRTRLETLAVRRPLRVPK
jgi:hypothetical protein